MPEPTPEEWGARYAEGFTPWDVGFPHPELVARLEKGWPDKGRALVPGCGLGHDARARAEAGWHVIAVDFAPDLEDMVAERLRPFGGEFMRADALKLELDEPVDLIFDHTFYCAIDPSRRPEHGQMVERLLRPGGTYAAIVTPKGEPVEGPPWGMKPAHITENLAFDFEVVADEPTSHAVPRRAGREGWFELLRTNS